MKMITPGVADSLTPHGWYDRPRRTRSLVRLRLPSVRPARVRLPTLHVRRVRPGEPQA